MQYLIYSTLEDMNTAIEALASWREEEAAYSGLTPANQATADVRMGEYRNNAKEASDSAIQMFIILMSFSMAGCLYLFHNVLQ